MQQLTLQKEKKRHNKLHLSDSSNSWRKNRAEGVYAAKESNAIKPQLVIGVNIKLFIAKSLETGKMSS